MTYRTVHGILQPDGTLRLTGEPLPDHPVSVMVTILDADEDKVLADLGDYHNGLVDYEERLARGEIQWE